MSISARRGCGAAGAHRQSHRRIVDDGALLAFDVVIVSGLFGVVSYIVAPRIMTSIEGEPLLVEDLVNRQAELRAEFDAIVGKSEGWLRDEIEEKVRKRFFGVGFLLRQLIKPRTTPRPCWLKREKNSRIRLLAPQPRMNAVYFRTQLKLR